ncbi:SAM-dependent methyltransferase [Rossellomorea marisflavi]|uniref:SAM-dependent methyltransferase n=1 Tax=Rossellomorea marisflavi TaxID=189381 RepID=A0A0M0GNG6_9BACI|nr:tRNA (adenine(22)-N(1))-methyltransferase TrmK [Rossellomorea marisflavi]KON91333.1 SAM-dependent methyltransferase [Rossellomorea marisflavi]
MNSEKLSKRLETVVSYIPKDSTIADIGSDHAYLPCYAIQRGIAASAIAGEVVKGPFESAVKQVKLNALENRVDVRLGDGLDVLRPGEVDCITIAGMGGPLIASILEKGKAKVENARLILQPNISAVSIREWLMDNGWSLLREEILEEDGKIYEVLVAEKGDPKAGYSSGNLEAEILMGPLLSTERSAPFRKKWTQEMTQWKVILKNMEQAEETPALEERRNDLLVKIKLVEEVLNR